MTGDRDLFQLVDDERAVRILYIARGVGKHEIVDEASVTERYGIPGRAYADFATLRGDPSDGLPGVPGVGDKTAAALITKYGSLDGILAALDAGDTAMPAGARAKLMAARDYLAVAPVVVAVAKDAKVPAYDGVLPSSPADPERLLELVRAVGAQQLAEPGADGLRGSGHRRVGDDPAPQQVGGPVGRVGEAVLVHAWRATETCPSRSITCLVQRTKSPACRSVSRSTASRESPEAQR